MHPLPTSVNSATCFSFQLLDGHAHKHFLPTQRVGCPCDIINLQARELLQGLYSSRFTKQELNDGIHKPDTDTAMQNYIEHIVSTGSGPFITVVVNSRKENLEFSCHDLLLSTALNNASNIVREPSYTSQQ